MILELALLLAVVAQEPRTAAASEALVGKPAPTVALDLLDGKHFNLADHKGKIVFLTFWATWCEPCRRDIPLLLHAEANHKDVLLVGVTTEARAEVTAFIKDAGFANFTTALDPAEQVTKAYGVDRLPRLFVIDQKGIVARMIRGLPGEGTIKRALESLAP